MRIASFIDMYISELQELANMEQQLAETMLFMSGVASHPSLRNALTRHRDETLVQAERLNSILRKYEASAEAHTDQTMEALVAETERMLKFLDGENLRDAGLIASAQKLEHYEIAAYGTAAALAGQLDLRDDQRMLHDSLEEERAADALLTKLAKGEINQDAVEE